MGKLKAGERLVEAKDGAVIYVARVYGVAPGDPVKRRYWVAWGGGRQPALRQAAHRDVARHDPANPRQLVRGRCADADPHPRPVVRRGVYEVVQGDHRLTRKELPC